MPLDAETRGPRVRSEAFRVEEAVASGAAAEHEFFLATLPPTLRQRRIALAVVLALFIAVIVVAPFRAIQLPQSATVVAVMQVTVLINDLVTATLLYAQYAVLRWRSLLLLAGGYLLTALIGFSYSLSFPGFFAPNGLLGNQTTGWLFLIWHSALPVAVIAYVLLKDADRARKVVDEQSRAPIGFNVIAVILLSFVLTGVAMTANDVLPPLFLHVNRVGRFAQVLAGLVALLTALALALLWVRRRSVLDLWLMVMLVPLLLDVVFVALVTAVRFSVSFYAARTLWVVTASVILLVLLAETTALYARLARSYVISRREREERMTVMDAMSASIAHELSQPLGAMIANAHAAQLWLSKTPPDLAKARTSVERIEGDGRRASDVIASLRALFQSNSLQKQLLDVNDLIREVLAIEHAELKGHGVVVRVDLADSLPQVFCERIQLQQVIMNLMRNAAEAMRPVNDRARVLRLSSELYGSGDVRIKIEDSGPGINPRDIDIIFEPFFTTKSGGMGLGLWICRTIVQDHDGRLTASPGIAHGVVFQIDLPGGSAGAAKSSWRTPFSAVSAANEPSTPGP
jgi:signal transduction histidine kinase